MHKNMHKEEKDPFTNLLSLKSLFFSYVPENCFMLTTNVKFYKLLHLSDGLHMEKKAL